MLRCVQGCLQRAALGIGAGRSGSGVCGLRLQLLQRLLRCKAAGLQCLQLGLQRSAVVCQLRTLGISGCLLRRQCAGLLRQLCVRFCQLLV